MTKEPELVVESGPGEIWDQDTCSTTCPYCHEEYIPCMNGVKKVCILFSAIWKNIVNNYQPRCPQCLTMFPHGADIEVKAKAGNL